MSNNIFLKKDEDDNNSSDEEVKTIEKIGNTEIKHFKNIIKDGIIGGPNIKSKSINKTPTKKTPLDSFNLLTNQNKNNDKFSDSEDKDDEDDDSISLSYNDNFETISNNSKLSNKSKENIIDFDKPFKNINETISLDNFENDDNQDDEDDNENDGDIDESSFNPNDEVNTLSTNDNGDEEIDDESDNYSVREKTYEEIQNEKQELLFKLDRLEKSGFKPSRKYTMASNLEDLNYEYTKLKRQRDVEKSIKFSRKILMAIVSGVEFLNGKFDPFDIRLKGWSENVMESITDYDEVFEELHDKYSESVKVSPELKLIMMVAGSAFMFHLTQSLFKTNSPSLNDILKQNPDIMKNIGQAAAQSMGPAMGDDFIGNLMKEGINQAVNKPSQQSSQNTFTNSKPIMQPSGPMRMDLNKNSNLDDIVREISNDNKKKSNKSSKKGNGITLDL